MNDKWFLSSTGTEDLSLTLKGFLLSIGPLAILAAKSFGYQIEQQQIEQVILAVTSIVSGLMILWGVARKIYFYFKPSK